MKNKTVGLLLRIKRYALVSLTLLAFLIVGVPSLEAAAPTEGIAGTAHDLSGKNFDGSMNNEI